MLPTCAGQPPPPASALSGCVRCPQGLPSPTWGGGGPDTAPWPKRAGPAPAQKPLEGWVSPWGAPTPSLTVAPGDPALRGREPEPPAQRHLLSSRCRAGQEDAPGMASVPRLCLGQLQPACLEDWWARLSSLTGTCACGRRRGRQGGGRGSTCRVPSCRGRSAQAPSQDCSGLTRGLWLQQRPGSPARTACLPLGSSPALPGQSAAGRGSSPPHGSIFNPLMIGPGLQRVGPHSFLISAWTDCLCLGHADLAPRLVPGEGGLSGGGPGRVLPLGVIG